jgi:hypothetical protein
MVPVTHGIRARKELNRMELQPISPAFVEALRIPASNDLPGITVREIKAEPARAVPARPTMTLRAEETIILDQRGSLTPAQSVEQKLSAMLRGGAAIPVSHFRLAKLCRKSV